MFPVGAASLHNPLCVWLCPSTHHFCLVVSALLRIRQHSEAHRIEAELNEKNAAEGITEKVEVDPTTVDWLYGTHQLKGDTPEEGEHKVRGWTRGWGGGGGTQGEGWTRAVWGERGFIKSSHL